MANLPRRKFLKTIGSAAVASALPNALLAAQQKSATVAVFWQQGFPSIQDCGITKELLEQALSGFAVSFLNTEELVQRLQVDQFDLLITPYGSAFPKRLWRFLLKYLQAGGNWLNLGGVPLSRPVVRVGGEWEPESHQTTFHKLPGITHSFPVQTTAIAKYDSAQEFASVKADEIYELYIRLSSSNNEPAEAGSDGPYEGLVVPLVSCLNRDGRAIAAPVIQIDRLQKDFAGGRWMFANFRGSLATRARAP